MKVALDATPLTLASGGIPRYVRELSLALARAYPEDEYLLLCDRGFDPPEGAPANLRCGSPARRWADQRWFLWGVQREMRRLGCRLFHGTNFVVPWLPLRPSVVTVHDLSPWRKASWRAGSEFVRRRTPMQVRLGLATLVLTPSEAVRREVIEKFSVSGERVAVTPLAAPKEFQPVEGKRPDQPYFLYVGALEPRKNVEMLVDAWREVRAKRAVELVLIGPVGHSGLRGNREAGLHVLGEVSDSELPAWYSGAAAVAYPSLYEGFGLPVLEAMQCGAMVLASRIPSIQEVAGDAAVLLDPQDRRAWVEALTAALEKPEQTAEWRQRGRIRAAAFSWERTARLTREAYQEAIRRWGG